MQASRSLPKVKVLRKPFTPRSNLIEGRFNALIELEAKVPQNSYLFTWSGEPKPIIIRPFMNEIRKTVEAGKVTLQDLESMFRRIMTVKKRKLEGRKTPPSYDNIKYIPGSSIKGAIRSRIEYKFAPKMVDGTYKSQACYIVQGDAREGRHANFWGVDETYKRERLCSGEEGRVCIVCDLFGAPSLSSRVQISDALLKSGEIKVLPELGLEAFTPNSLFNLEISALNLNYAELGLLLLGFEIPSKSPILMGLKKYFYNPKVGNAYRNKYYFGLLKVNLINLVTLDSMMNKETLEPERATNICLTELKRSEYNDWLDYERGVIL
jgi:hypothetical protein